MTEEHFQNLAKQFKADNVPTGWGLLLVMWNPEDGEGHYTSNAGPQEITTILSQLGPVFKGDKDYGHHSNN